MDTFRHTISAAGLTRRGFLTGSAACGALALPPASPAMAKGTEQPARGGTLRIAVAATPRGLDPQKSLAFSEIQFSSMMFDNLTRLAPDARPMPSLALSWRASKGGAEWVFDLRPGVRFHHGRELTSADVVATVERAMDPAKALLARGYFGPVRSVVADGPHRVRFILTQPFAELPAQLASRLTWILPADHLDQQATHPIGTGPFKFESLQPGSSASVVRNDHWWIKGRPYVDRVRMVVIREHMAQQAAIMSGAVDIISRIPTEGALTLRHVPKVRLYSVASGDYHAMITQANLPPFNNAKVREAFKYILDRKTLVQSVLLGQGTAGNDVPIPPGNAYLPDLAQRTQDLDRAKKLIAEAGVGPIELDLYASSERPPAPKLAVAFVQAASQIGVKIRFRDVTYTEYAASVARKKPFYISQWSANGTLYGMLYQKYHSNAVYNYGKVEQAPGLDALLEQMVAEVDFNRRKALVAEICNKIRDSSERIIPYFLNYIGATTDKIQGFIPPQFNTFDVSTISISP